ncbi:hypothetical protein CSKR_112379 [Clonorchis sinensis]|uniref:Uncharacterized protein n=1 Tax=Clonorchis sinensis TaxID=79923 RepID=A0A3R7CD28_CLOSI|nr:hypothetical protein CSKR_112379 [Clonorchis sinensis]
MKETTHKVAENPSTAHERFRPSQGSSHWRKSAASATQSRLAHQAQRVRHTGSGVGFSARIYTQRHVPPIKISYVRTQEIHKGEQTKVTGCDLRKSQSNNSLGGLRKADRSIRDDHRLVGQKVDITTDCA